MVNCVAYGCDSRSEKKEPNVSFHRFPKNEKICSIWVRNMNLADFIPTKNCRLCSKHFEKKWFFKTDNHTKLLEQAVPSIFVQPPNVMQRTATNGQMQHPILAVEEDNITQKEHVTLHEESIQRQLQILIMRNRRQAAKIQTLSESVENLRRKVALLKDVKRSLEMQSLTKE